MLIIANWKLNKTISEGTAWLQTFQSHISNTPHPTVEVVVCPSFVVIPELKREIETQKLPIKLGAQDISQFEKGQYTGEVSAEMLKGFVSYVTVGHSERRQYFGETNEIIAQKVSRCQKNGLVPILCVSELDQLEGYEGAKDIVVVYEPLEAISTKGKFHPDDPNHANEIAGKIKNVVGTSIRVLYGGSVHEKNAKEFIKKETIDGLLVGQASLDAKQFSEIVKKIT